MDPNAQALASTTATNARGQYGDSADQHIGTGGVLFVLGLAVGVYALSPGARHFYKHGRLPPSASMMLKKHG